MKKIIFIFCLIIPAVGISQQAIPYDELSTEERWKKSEFYMDDNRAVELRPVINTSDSIANEVVVDGKQYLRFDTRQEAIDYFTALEIKVDYIIFYVNDISAVEIFEERRKILRKQFYNREDLPRVKSEIIQLK